MRIVYLSPHLDDAILSAGGLIRAQVNSGAQVELWTFMAGTPEDNPVPEFAQVMHRIWGFADAVEGVRVRRAEDLRAAAEVGARAVHFDFLDCIYRRSHQGIALYSDVSLPIQPDDEDLAAQVAQTMIAWLRPDDTVICQLAIGRHVDHVIVRKAAEMLHRPLTYIADMPYLLNHPEELAPSTAGLVPNRQPVSQAGLDCWILAIESYTSQVDSVFGSREAMRESMLAFWHAQRGIDFWTAASGS